MGFGGSADESSLIRGLSTDLEVGDVHEDDRYGHWNSVWKRFDRLSKAGVF
jgi:hypothetical protein